ncbi:enoyl-CoA hydratase/isomerase family protein [Piscinibacter sakaiensis]|uniref:Enoyl-CoA hydratase n=1 Tax=Piscinibacter sakaiensis TaxID=1547922 RepID=A0A0K8P3T1_PISS1|nr:enoyl-CoA hydratase/isomerase family protein [Piscinibacter sakaiensis]GAP37219.1 enoyl-CoA hydratase [Piscinibacter sakaiensis]
MEALLFDRHEGVATLTLNRPQARNAIDMTLRQELGEAVLAVRDDPAVHALVITGAGGSFCAGGDLRSIQAGTPDVEAWRGRMRSSHAWFAQLLAMDKPVVCAVDGPAYGAGFGLALAGDFVLASTRARFCLSFMRVGLVPDFGIFYTLPRVVGVQRARELMLSAREVDADEALRLGIAMERLAPEALLPRAQALAASFGGASRLAVSLVKRSCAAAPQGDLAAMLDIEANAQALCFMTDAHRDAVARFLNKQTPAFQWPAQPGEHS